MNQNYGEVLCQAVDEIVRKRLEGVSYDQTILCTIVDDSKREQGIYVVTNNNTTKFEAVSAVANYRNKDNVYVQIPNGDWNQQKIIVAKKTSKNDEPFIYKRPFESLVDITGNLIENKIDPNATGLLANSNEYQRIQLWSYNSETDGESYAAYTRLGIQAGFKSLISPFYDNDTVYNVTNGDYGLKLVLVTVDEKASQENKTQRAEYTLYLNCEDMNGNPYDFQSYYTQEKVFDISQVGKIVSISLEFYQTPGSFTSGTKPVPHTDFLGNLLQPNLFTNDVYISLGYDISEFDSEQAYIYTLDSTTYAKTKDDITNSKQVQLRWIHKTEDNNFISVTEKHDLDYEIRWYRYCLGAPSADKYSGVYWNLLATQKVKTDADSADNINTFINGKWIYQIFDKSWLNYNKTSTTDIIPSFFNTYLLPDITEQQEQIKAIVIYNNLPYRSNILVCENDDQTPNKATIDAVQALSITCNDDSYGNYRIYNHGNLLLDPAEASVERYFIPLFNSSTDTNLDDNEDDVAKSPELKEAEQVEWIIPTANTMIALPKDVDCTIDSENRAHIVIKGGGVLGNDVENICYQKYYIKNYYSQNNTNNIVQCKVTKNNTVYTATKELTFGVAGSTGTEYTFILDFDDGRTAINNTIGDIVTVRARLYNYQNKEETIPNAVSWSWKDGGTTASPCGLLSINGTTATTCKIRTTKNWNANGESYGILQGELVWGDWKLYAYLPIPIRSSTNHAYISGTTNVVYASDGCLSAYINKNPYKIFNTVGTEASTTWEIFNNNKDESNDYLPHLLKDNSGQYYLSPLKFYVEDACKLICVVGKANGVIAWSQPILILHDKYGIDITNQWDGSLDVGEQDQGTILAPRLVAGKKNSNNTFSGVVLGDWEATNSDLHSGTGLFGYYEGEQSYGFRDDGTAFIGKTGVGRIEFKGDQGIIESSAYNAGQGMSINLTAGTIDAHQFTLSAGDNVFNATEYIRLTTDVNDNPLTIGNQFWVEWDGTLHATNGVFDGDGVFNGTINATGGTLTGDLKVTGTISGGTIDGSTITGGSITGTTIDNGNGSFSVGANGDLFASSATITGTVTATAGQLGNWNIEDGAIFSDTTTLGADGSFGSSNATITGGSLNIGSGQFTVDTEGNMIAESATMRGHVEATSGSIGGWYMYEGYDAPPNSPGQASSRGWKALYSNYGNYWTVFDAGRDNVIAVGITGNYVFQEGDGGHNHAQLRITNAGDLIIGGDKAPFKVTQEGVLTATSGTIGGWTIGEDSLSTTGLTLSASTSGAQLSGGGNATKARAASSGYWAIKGDGSAEFSNLKITGGEITITNNGKTAFAVTSAGELTATSGNIAGWAISADSLTSTNITLSNSTTDKAKAINVSNGTFYVQNDGYMFASSGSIGGWTIGTNSLTSSGNTNIVLSSASTGNAIKVGSNFTVATDGSMTAKAGTIGGWTINSTSLKSVNKCITLYGNAGSTTTANAIYIQHPNDNEYFFRVQNNGFVEARAGTIGTWNLSQHQLRFNNSNTFYFNTGTGDLTISGKLTASSLAINGAISGKLSATNGVTGTFYTYIYDPDKKTNTIAGYLSVTEGIVTTIEML